ncbi:MAG: DUF6198 family protein [Eubacteriales bacterium]|nr:DUF6198 family protein [Eubacteriales bacterium]
MKEKVSVKRFVWCVIGLMIAGLGVAITKKGELGVSPVSSVANIMSLKFDSLSMGNWLIIWNCVLILGQIILLRKKFQIFQLLQIPLSVLFGAFTDVGLKALSGIPVDNYFVKLVFVFVGTAVVALGVTVSVKADVIYNSGEAFVKAISSTFGPEFANVKIAFDVGCVIVSVILSLLFFHLRIEGTREGTIIAALLTGVFVKIFSKALSPRK